MKLLLVEDNRKLAGDIVEYLSGQGFTMEHVETYTKAHEKVMLYGYELVILDLGLPDRDGIGLLEVLREQSPETAVIILTAKHSLEYKLKGLDLGADDYMTKPFHNAELNARIRSVLRRKYGNNNNAIEVGDLEINIASAEVRVHDQVLNLTRKKYDLLLYLVYNKNRLLTKESIAEHLWGDHADQADSLDFIYNHIKNLRRKITKAGGNNYLKSMYGMGYKFEISEES